VILLKFETGTTLTNPGAPGRRHRTVTGTKPTQLKTTATEPVRTDPDRSTKSSKNTLALSDQQNLKLQQPDLSGQVRTDNPSRVRILTYIKTTATILIIITKTNCLPWVTSRSSLRPTRTLFTARPGVFPRRSLRDWNLFCRRAPGLRNRACHHNTNEKNQNRKIKQLQIVLV
jgi:hypothetical protein